MISIIVPIYNAERYLKRCINSILNQSYTDLEIILVDDGSTDQSLDICKYYMHNDTRIKLIQQENSGVAAARNAGLRIAKGEYITFVDSDDYIERNMYEKMIGIVNQYHCDIVMCDCVKEFDNYTEIYTHNIRPGFYNREQIEKEYFPHLLVMPDINYPPTISNCLCLFKNAYDRNIYYEQGIRFSEDWLFGVLRMYQANSFYYLKGGAYYHYDCSNQNSATHVFVADKWNDYEKLYLKMVENFWGCKEWNFLIQLDKVLLFLIYNAVGEILSTDKLETKDKVTNSNEILSQKYIRDMFSRINIMKLPISLKLKVLTYMYKYRKGLKIFIFFQSRKRRKRNVSR